MHLGIINKLFIIILILSGITNPGTDINDIIFSCSEQNDIYKVLLQNEYQPRRFKSPIEAVKHASPGSGVLLLAEEYPKRQFQLNPSVFNLIKEKQLKVYIEYPDMIPGLDFGKPLKAEFERGVVTSDFFGSQLPPKRIVMVHDCHYLPVVADNPHLVIAKVAGFDEAVYGLKDTPFNPVLFEHDNMLIATTGLSHFISGRYAPTDAWFAIWKSILQWLQPDIKVIKFDWAPAVVPSFTSDKTISQADIQKAVKRGTDWFINAKMLLHPLDCPQYDSDSLIWQDCEPSVDSIPAGDGKLGVLEGLRSKIRIDGTQETIFNRRYDCNAETGGAFAAAGVLFNDENYRQIAANILDFTYSSSIMSNGKRIDPHNPGFGLIGWYDTRAKEGRANGYDVYYGDDNARGLFGTIAAAGLLKTDRWDERIIQCILSNFRTSGIYGFRNNRIEQNPLEENGWQYYNQQDYINYAPHYQCYLWACYLWAWHHTQYQPFMDKAKIAIKMTLDAYPHEWHWTNGMQQERARMILPLAWLVRVDDTAEHRKWLKDMTAELLAYQDDTGAIREYLGDTGKGKYKAPTSNAHYGTTEAPLIQSNGDKVCDLLYTTNFALLGLHEAAAATQDDYYLQAEERLIDFLCRIQVKSSIHDELDGAWFRAFDFKRWEYWASNADAGWGAWCVETGWTQAWITMILAFQQMDTNIWELSKNTTIADTFEKNLELMLPQNKSETNKP